MLELIRLTNTIYHEDLSKQQDTNKEYNNDIDILMSSAIPIISTSDCNKSINDIFSLDIIRHVLEMVTFSTFAEYTNNKVTIELEYEHLMEPEIRNKIMYEMTWK